MVTEMAQQSIQFAIRSLYRALSAKEASIADFILSDPKRVSRMTINEIADSLGIAPSTVFQFTRKLGFKGFRDFRNELLSEEFDPEVSIHENIDEKDDALAIAHKVFSSSVKSLQDTNALLSASSVERASHLLLEANTVSFFGVGGSNVVAYDAFHKFMRSPLRVQYGMDVHVQRMQAALLGPGDCAIVTTHTGLTRDTLDIASIAREAGASVIAITSYSSPRLAELADVILLSSSDETGYRSESLSSRIAQLAIVDSLFTIVMFASQERAKEPLRRIRNAISPTKEE